MMMNKMMSCMSVVSLLGLLLSTTTFPTTTAIPTAVSIIHINDHHSNIDELTFDVPRTSLNPLFTLPVNSTGVRVKYGSFARVVSLMKQLEAEAVANASFPIKLHAGDAITGTVYFSFFGSIVDSTVLNLAGFDALTLGNHEFDEGDTFLADFINNLTVPVLSANVVPGPTSNLTKAGVNLFRPYIIKTLGNGQRVGICGITTKLKTEQSSFPDPGTTVRVEKIAATECAQNLTAQGINKIVLLTHIGYSNDLNDMATIPNVDVVVGGDSHTLLGSAGPFAGTGIFSPLGPYATMVGNVCVVQAWEYGKVVGKLDILFDTNGNVTRCVGQPNLPINADQDANNTYQVLGPGFPATLFLNTTDKALLTAWLLGKGIFANVTADPVVTAAVKPFKDASAAAGGRVVGSANTSICHTTFNDDVVCPNRPLTNCLGGGVCNLVARGFLFNVPTADFAIQNAGGCRTDILAGNITFSNLVTILPFSNTLVTMQMTGQEIKNAMEDAANFFLGLGGGPGSYPFAAGLRWQVDYNAAFGSRFTNIEMNPKLAGVWAPLNLTRSYGVVTNSFIGTGRDGYFAFNASTVQATFVNTFVEYAQSFINYVSSINGPLNEPPLGNFSSQRMRFLTQRVCDVSLNVTFPSPVAPPVAPAAPTAPVVAPAVAPVAPKATTKAPTKIPTQAPVKPKRCGLLKLSVFCPLTQCGLIGKWLGLCNND